MDAANPGLKISGTYHVYLLREPQHCRGRLYAGQEAAAISGRMFISGDLLVEAKVHRQNEAPKAE